MDSNYEGFGCGLAVGICMGASMVLPFNFSQKQEPKEIVDSPVYIKDLNEDGKPDYVFNKKDEDKKFVLLSQPDGSYRTLDEVRKVLIEEARQEALNNFDKGIEAKLSDLK